MAGWNLKRGEITDTSVSDDEYWSLFNYVFSTSCSKTNTYKFGLIKALLDSVFSHASEEDGLHLTYEEVFAKFAENYWNLVVKYNLKQMKETPRASCTRIEKIFYEAVAENPVLKSMEFSAINDKQKRHLVHAVATECRRYVVGALYADFQGKLYAFDLSAESLTICPRAVHFMMRYKTEIERLNYYAWAKYLEEVNSGAVLTNLIDKLELATPRRKDLSIYRQILHEEFEVNTCFYCGRKLTSTAHVDHFIPWSFIKDDKLWNFVLACPHCNEKKNNRLPSFELVNQIEDRNRYIVSVEDEIHNEVVTKDFASYTDHLVSDLWQYARIGGYIEYLQKGKLD